MDAGYGNNTSFLEEVEKRKLKYIGGIAGGVTTRPKPRERKDLTHLW
jgi:SRSO17 transposase